LLGPKNYQLKKTLGKTLAERGFAGYVDFIAGYESGRIERTKENETKYKNYSNKVDKELSQYFKLTSQDANGTAYDTYFKVLGAGKSVTIAEGKKAQLGLDKTTRSKIGAAYLETSDLLYSLGDIADTLKQSKGKVSGFMQKLVAKTASMVSYFTDPNFDPTKYEGVFQDLVQAAPERVQFEAQVDYTFQKFLRKPITGAQAAIKELADLRKQLLNGETPTWEMLARLVGLTKVVHSQALRLKEAYNKSELPPLPGINELLKHMSMNEVGGDGSKQKPNMNDLFEGLGEQ